MSSAERNEGGRLRLLPQLFLESLVLLCGLLLFAGRAGGLERHMLLAFVPFLLFVGLLMAEVGRRFTSQSGWIVGISVTSLGAWMMLAGIADTGFLVWEAALGYLFTARVGFSLADPEPSEEQARRYFLWECAVIPVLTLVAFRQGGDPSLLIFAVVMYLLLRGFSLVYAQKLASGAWSFRMRGLLLVAAAAVLLLLLALVFPVLGYGLSSIGAYALALLERVTRQIHQRPLEPTPSPAEEGTVLPPDWNHPEEVQSNYHLPESVWIGLVLLVVVGILAVMKRHRPRREAQPPSLQVSIRRSRAAEPGKRLAFTPGAAGLRRVYQSLLRGMAAKGRAVRPEETPREYAGRLLAELPEAQAEEDELREFVRRYERERYGAEAGSSAAPEGDAGRAGSFARLVDRLLAFSSAKGERGARRKG